MTKKKSELFETRQFQRYDRNDNFVIRIPRNFCTKWQLDPSSAMIYHVIAYADGLEYGCYVGSLNDLATITYLGVNTVRRILDKLQERGFIAKVKIYVGKNKPLIAYKNLGTDCTIPYHIGKPFSTSEKLTLNLSFKQDIITAWKKQFRYLDF